MIYSIVLNKIDCQNYTMSFFGSKGTIKISKCNKNLLICLDILLFVLSSCFKRKSYERPNYQQQIYLYEIDGKDL